MRKLPKKLKRDVTAEEIKLYQEVGAVVIRDILDASWLDFMQEAIEDILSSPTKGGSEYTDKTGKEGRFYGDYFLWLHHQSFKQFLFDSPMPELASQIMQSSQVKVFYDHLLVKEPGANAPTPLHQDIPYWPARGDDVLSIWVPFDPASKETGVVQYIKGSHLWGKQYAPKAFSKESNFDDTYEAQSLDSVADVEKNIDQYDILCPEIKAGDVLIHHPLTLHFAEGNSSKNIRRRGLSLRYFGDDAVYDNKAGTFMDNEKVKAIIPKVDLSDGDAMAGELFPLVWPHS